ncbi:MAG: SDR family oxidoreductase [Bryobacterales bacterium]|nr:SDR family oxidoreductase [Bryobacterales bacterium]
MDLALTGQTVVVTGGASGIGRGIAEGFAAEGARVVLWDIAANTAEAAAEIPHASGFAVDVTNPESIAAALAATGAVDHLVHAAAVGSGKFGFPFTNLTPADWPRVLTVNIIGMVNIAHALAPGMIERQRGTMTFIASIAGQIGSQTDPPYSASKAANINFAQCLAKDLAPHGIRVNTVCPGMVKTPLNRAIWQAWHDRQAPADQLDFETWGAEKIRKSTPLGTWQTAADIADMTVFLASRRAGQVTGQTINVDGGFVMHW